MSAWNTMPTYLTTVEQATVQSQQSIPQNTYTIHDRVKYGTNFRRVPKLTRSSEVVVQHTYKIQWFSLLLNACKGHHISIQTNQVMFSLSLDYGSTEPRTLHVLQSSVCLLRQTARVVKLKVGTSLSVPSAAFGWYFMQRFNVLRRDLLEKSAHPSQASCYSHDC